MLMYLPVPEFLIAGFSGLNKRKDPIDVGEFSVFSKDNKFFLYVFTIIVRSIFFVGSKLKVQPKTQPNLSKYLKKRFQEKFLFLSVVSLVTSPPP